MVIMFQGTHESNNCVTGAAATLAVLSAIKYNRKTLMIQLTGTGRSEMQMLLVGKQIEESRIVAEMNSLRRINDRGIDALMRRAEVAKLVKEHFDSSCEPLLEAKKASENMLDIAGITKKEDFIDTISVKSMDTILKHAKEVYDNIIVLLDGKNETVMKDVLQLADVCITCVSQSSRVEKFNQYENVRVLNLVTDYETTSTYSLRYIKGMYHVNHMYSFPHNIGYKDACISGTLLDFLMKNVNVTNNDDNYDFMKNVIFLMEGIMGKDKWEEMDDSNSVLMDAKQDEMEELKDCDSIQIEEQVKRKGLFGKKTVMHVSENRTEDLDEEPEEDSEIEEEDIKKMKKSNDVQKKEKRSIFGKKKQADAEIIPEKEIQASSKDTWKCPECGTENTGKFCSECGFEKPVVIVPEQDVWKCPACDTENTGKFCSECGAKKPEKKEWKCPECGTENTGKFCSECGAKR